MDYLISNALKDKIKHISDINYIMTSKEKKMIYYELMHEFAKFIKQKLNEDSTEIHQDVSAYLPGEEAVDTFILNWIDDIDLGSMAVNIIQDAQVDYKQKAFEHSVWHYGPELLESMEDELQSLRKALGKIYRISSWQVEVRDLHKLGYDQVYFKYGYNSKRFIDIIVADINKNRSLISNAMDEWGYVLIREVRQIAEECVMVHMFYVKKNPEPITEEIMNNYEFLYHMTPETNTERIIKIGLIPKPRNGTAKDSGITYPPRIYMSTDIDFLKEYIRTLIIDHDTEDFSIIKIETAKLQKNIKFYLDPLFGRPCIYTENSIFPNAVSLEE